MTQEDCPKAPVTLAVSSSSGLRERLSKLLERIDVEVDSVSIQEDVRRIVAEGRGRVLLLDRSQLPDDPTAFIEELLCEEDAPALVIVSDSDPYERVQMLAAGATTVLDPGLEDEGVVTTLEAVTTKEAQGGVNQPEIRGNSAQPQLADFLSRSRSMQRFVQTAERVADVECSLLVTGETGVGKERLARAIHAASSRSGQFVGVNCGALPEALLESQLFGHAAGAFTGARGKHSGFFEQAAGGTLFLDEIGEVPLHLQVKLLTVLQRHEVQPLGAEKAIPVDVRIIAATNRVLRDEVRESRFREDLYYRLNVINLHVPPLRNRVADIPDLVGALIQFFRCDLLSSKVETISEPALEALMGYHWPGNIRELINVVERGMILSDGPELAVKDLPLDIKRPVEAGNGAAPESRPSNIDEWSSMSLKECREAAASRAERTYLDSALRAHVGKLSDTAKHAKIGKRSLYDKMQRYGLRKEDYRSSGAQPSKAAEAQA